MFKLETIFYAFWVVVICFDNADVYADDFDFHYSDQVVLIEIRKIVQEVRPLRNHVMISLSTNPTRWMILTSKRQRKCKRGKTVGQFNILIARVRHEVNLYVEELDTIPMDTNPLSWWKYNSKRFPKVAIVARKWLAVSATSTPSERVFSICGIVNDSKRSRTLATGVEDQVFTHCNYDRIRS
jgi:hypothetical protein